MYPFILIYFYFYIFLAAHKWSVNPALAFRPVCSLLVLLCHCWLMNWINKWINKTVIDRSSLAEASNRLPDRLGRCRESWAQTEMNTWWARAESWVWMRRWDDSGSYSANIVNSCTTQTHALQPQREQSMWCLHQRYSICISVLVYTAV